MKIICHDLLRRFREPGPCEICLKQCKVREPAHIVARGLGGGGHLDVPVNLLSLGSTPRFECQCHYNQHATGIPDRTEMQFLAAAREGMTFDEVLEIVWKLQRARKPTRECLPFEHEAVKVGRDYFVCAKCGVKVVEKVPTEAAQ